MSNFPLATEFQTGQGAIGTNDPNWTWSNSVSNVNHSIDTTFDPTQWINPLDPSVVFSPAPITANHPAWQNPASLPAPLNQAKWIGTTASGGVPLNRFFRKTFTLPATCGGVPIENSGFSLTFDGYVDDRILAIYINGNHIPVTGLPGGNFAISSRITFTVNSNWVAGTNHLDILVAGFADPTGLLLTVASNSLNTDSDGDGVPDYLDECPCEDGLGTNGCPVTLNITSSATTICAGTSTTLSANFSHAVQANKLLGGIIWYDETGTQVGTGSTLTVSPTTNKTYTAKQEYVTGTELVINGNFEQGNTGFYTNLNLFNGTVDQLGIYAVGVPPTTITSIPFQQYITNHNDHTTGQNGNYNYMIIQDYATPNNIIWKQLVPVLQNKKYVFQAYIAMTSLDPNNTLVDLLVRINGSNLNSTSSVSVNPANGWQLFYSKWDSQSNSSANIEFITQNAAYHGLDFALDDISFREVAEITSSQTITITPSVITATASPSFVETPSPVQLTATGTCLGATYTWTKPDGTTQVSTAANGLLTVTPTTSGWYTVSNNGATDQVYVEIGTSSSLTIQPNKSLICKGDSVVLTSTPTGDIVGTVDWLAGTTVLGTGTALTQTPAVTTTYTARTLEKIGGNLVVNGNFESGNNSFQSPDYTYKASGNLIPGEYTVGTKPINHNPAHGNFGDHTTGIGKMLIVDGLTAATDTTFWKQTVSTTVGEKYILEYYVTNNNQLSPTEVPATILTKINGTITGSPVTTTTTGTWLKQTIQFTATNATTVIELLNQNTQYNGNDTSIDDISLYHLVPVTSSPVTITVVDPQAPVLSTLKRIINAGDAITITAAGCAGGTITWDNGTTGSTRVVAPQQTTTYTAFCTQNGCPSPIASITITVRHRNCCSSRWIH